MAAYVLVDVRIHDPETYAEYRKQAPPSIALYGGRYVARGGETAMLEGDWEPGRIVVLEFPSLEIAKKWWASAEYAPAKALRHKSSSTRMIAVEGL